ncbi:PilN domain-containing protein [Pseudomonas sp. 8209]|uniref:PilN domain-containing protein n=1 Tax=Pseudomonas sp. 8209 TaxID=2967214 RepID=UPI002363505C|nr:PilN domain-containing protein [Pseudomonas sp. 8209]MDD1956177.1 PilN domain-containing protein [Pseudomonas sp. 8209]
MRRDINLLPWRAWQRQRSVRQLQGLMLVALLLGVAIVVLLDRHGAYRLAQQGQANAALRDAIARLEGPLAELADLTARGDALQERIQGLDAVLRTASPGGQVLAPLATRVPQGLQLTALALEGSALRLEGVAQGRASVTQLLRNLDQAPGLGEVQLQEIKATAAGEVFHLSAQVQP